MRRTNKCGDTYDSNEKERNLIETLGPLEDILEKYEIDSLEDLDERLKTYKFLANHDYSTLERTDLNQMIDICQNVWKIEEKLGIKLDVLFKALKNGIYLKDGEKVKKAYPYEIELDTLWFDQEIKVFTGIRYDFNWRESLYTEEEKYIKNYKSHPLYKRAYNAGLCGDTSIKLEDYGDTWILVKNEL